MRFKRKVAILGATGTVGQRFIELLQNHPWFTIEVLAASKRSAGKKYKKACNWMMNTKLPPKIAEMPVVNVDLESVKKAGNIDLIFSALPGGLAGPVESDFAKELPVFSKASAHRMDSDVPLIIPEINPDHLKLISHQKRNRGWKGFISTDPNCSTIQLVITLKPLMKFGLQSVTVSTMQALSGAGYPGVASLDITDNVIPLIRGEESKIEIEPRKILGDFTGSKINEASFVLSASCNRINVKDGHLESVFVKLDQDPTVTEIKNAFIEFSGEPQKLGLPSAPEKPIVVKNEPDRPQPRFDKNEGKGMSVTVGRIRKDPIFTLKYMCLGHNTIRGAAGGGILSAELAIAKGIA